MELISREMAIDHMRVLGGEDRARLIGILNNKNILPTIESRPTGKWIIKPMETICNECNMSFSTEIHYLNWEMGEPNYCPNCGAYMQGQIDALKIGLDEA